MEENLDGNPVTGGTPAQPNAGGSQGQSDSGGSSAEQLQTTLEALTKRLDEVDKRSRSLQGDKDRGVNQTKSEIEELKRKFAEVDKLKKRGLSDDEAFEEISLRDAIQELRSQLKPTSTQPANAGNGNGMAVDKAGTLSQYGLSENDADVAAVLADAKVSSPLEMENIALKIAFKRSQKPNPDPSASSAISGGKPASTRLNEGEANAKYGELRGLLKNPSQNAGKIAQIQKELKEDGYEI